MTTFVGFNTIDQYKKFTLTDFDLIKRDLLNAFNIRQGEKPGRPEYGTNMWNFIFDSQTVATASAIDDEIRRVVGQDPRIYISELQVFTQENGILVELAVDTVGGATVERLNLLFDQESGSATFV